MCRRSSGFTLVEILVALAVVSIGITVLVAGFSSGLAMAKAGRNQTVAASLAEEQMQAILHNPSGYEWGLEKAKPKQLVKISVKGRTEEAYYVKPPAVLPVERSASAREENLYSQFTWNAYAKLSDADAAYVEVTIAVRWMESGRERVFALTSNMSRAAVTPRAEGSA